MKQAIFHRNYRCIHVPSHLCTHPFNQPASYLPTNQLAATFVLPPVRVGGWKLALVSPLIDKWIAGTTFPSVYFYTHALPDKCMDGETNKMYGWPASWRKSWVHRWEGRWMNGWLGWKTARFINGLLSLWTDEVKIECMPECMDSWMNQWMCIFER